MILWGLLGVYMTNRTSRYPILPVILNRWSPRAMSGESITQEQLFTLFEAARWAPSSFNNQPWSFIYATRDSHHWKIFVDLVNNSNKLWVPQAAVLIVVLSRTLFFYNDQPSRTHSFDTGAAVENLALQGASMGLVVHGMEGFDYDRTRIVLNIPQEYAIEALFAIGKPGNPQELPEPLQARERPSERKSIPEFVYEGNFGTKST